MENKIIIIPNIECMETEQYNELINLLDNCPVEYQEYSQFK